MTGSPQPAGLARRAAQAIGLAWAAGPATLVLVVLGTAAQGFVPVLLAWLTKLLLDDVSTPGPGAGWWALAGVLGVVATSGLLPHLNRYGQAVLRRGVELTVQTRLFAAVNRIPGLARFEQPSFHDRLQLAEQAGQAAPGQAVAGLTGAVQSAVTVAGFLSALLVVDARFTVVALAIGVPVLVAELRLSRARVALAWQLSPLRRQAVHYGMLQGDPQAAKEIRVFGLADFLTGRMTDLLRRAHREELGLDRRELRIQLGLALVGVATLAVGLAFVVATALRGGMGAGAVALTLAALPGVQSGLAATAQHAASIHQTLLLFGHYQGILAEAAAPATGRLAERLRSGIELRDVWFRYGEDQPWVLRGVSLTIPKGRTVAFVGVNGVGKSTIVKLLCRFYDPVRGSVRWDGTDLTEIAPDALRRRISAVFQDFMVYDLTAAENIGVGELDRLADRAAIRRAAARAGVDEALAALPQGYETMLSRIFAGGGAPDEQGGVLLSGGQWQRVAVARALLREDCDLLILDEPSSGLDAAAEYQLHRELRDAGRDRTIVLISHRLSTVREADLIVVLDDGVVVESGTHEELITRNGRYAELFLRQAAGYRTTGPVGRSDSAGSAGSAGASSAVSRDATSPAAPSLSI